MAVNCAAPARRRVKWFPVCRKGVYFVPNRIIKESICRSENINQLSAGAEVFFYRLLVNCDDYGRFPADPDLLASLLYPRKRSLKTSTVKKWLNEVANAGLIIIYENGGETFIQVRTWDKHQQIRNKRSKYPAHTDPDSKVLVDVYNGNQLIANDSKCPRNPIQSNPNKNPIQSEMPNGDGVADGFDLFWSVYPKKVGKKDAIKAWNKLKPDENLVKAIIEGVERWKGTEQWNKDGGQYIPYPATFLRQERWNDEIRTVVPKQQAPAEKKYDDDEDFLSS